MKLKNFLAVIALFISTISLAQETDMSLIPYRQGNKWGYANTDKKIIITPAYEEANWFSNGFASVKIGTKYGYINREGKLVIPAKFTVAKPFRKGYIPKANNPEGDTVLFAGASLVASGEEICINTKGTTLLKCPAISESSVPENTTPVETKMVEKNYSLANNNGLFDKIHDDYKITGTDETYYIASKNNIYGVFNSKFDTIVPFEYSMIKINRKAPVAFLELNRNGLYGVASTDGKITVNPEYDNMIAVNGTDGNEYLILKKAGKTYVKDISNTDIIPSGYADITYDNGGFVITDAANLKGFYFNGKRIIQPKYQDIKWLKGTGYLAVKTVSGKQGFINTSGEEYFTE